MIGGQLLHQVTTKQRSETATDGRGESGVDVYLCFAMSA